MSQPAYTDCRPAPPDPGCGTCDACRETAAAERVSGDGVLSGPQTVAVLKALTAEQRPPTS